MTKGTIEELSAGLVRWMDVEEDPPESVRVLGRRVLGAVDVTLPHNLEKLALAYTLVVIEVASGVKLDGSVDPAEVRWIFEKKFDKRTLEWTVGSVRSFLIGALAVYYRYNPQEMPPTPIL